MSGRITRRSQADLDFSSLTTLDCLILAQSVYELGTTSWAAVAKLLSKHPLLSHPKSFFTPQSCQAMYRHLRLEQSLEITDADAERHSPLNLKLAQTYYQARILELQSLIGLEEEKFRKLLSEIEDLRNKTVQDETKADSEDFTSDLSGISSISSPGKEEHKEPTPTPLQTNEPKEEADPPSPQMVEKDLLKPEPEDEETSATEKKIIDDGEDDAEEVESLAISGHVEVADENTPQPMAVDTTINVPSADAEDETISRSSRVPTPHESTAEPEPDRMEVVDEEGAASGDEPIGLQKARLAKAAKRQRKATTPIQPRKTRRTRRTSGAEMTPEIVETVLEDDKVQTPGTIEEEEASPAPEAISSKRQSKRRASLTDDNPREARRLRADSEPVDDDDGPGPSSSRRRRQDPSKRFQNVIGMLHSQISAHRNGTIFHNPIKNSEAPDYHEIVKRPMDLKTIKSKIKDGAISNSLEFQRDIYLMFANAMMYNRPGSDVYTMTEDMMLESEGYIQTFRQSEGFVRGSR